MARYNKMGITIFNDDELRFKAICELKEKKVSREICALMNKFFHQEYSKLTKGQKIKFEEIKIKLENKKAS